jgi:hypothetical protein
MIFFDRIFEACIIRVGEHSGPLFTGVTVRGLGPSFAR